MKTKEKAVTLRNLANAAGANIYTRCQLASEILSDHEYIADVYGDEGKARDAIEAECFADLRGFVSLGELVLIYRDFPDEGTWRSHRYDLAAMKALREQAHESPARGAERKSWKREAEQLQDKLDQADAMVEQMRSQRAEADSRVRELEIERARLLGRIEQLERELERRLSHAA